jgi:glycosyltransferase involved in cell wall biosynthesis
MTKYNTNAFKNHPRIWNLEDEVTLLLPVYNESEVIKEVIVEWQEQVFHYLPHNSRIIVEDANSQDGTWEILLELQDKFSNLVLTRTAAKDGFGSTVKRLLNEVQTGWFFLSDSDGQFLAEDFWKLAAHTKNYDLIKGAKVSRMDPLTRRIGSFTFNKIVNIIFNTDYSDINAGFLLAKKEVLNSIDFKSFKMTTMVTTELLIRSFLANFEIKQVFVNHKVRKNGRSRGVPTSRYLTTGMKAVLTLFKLKKSYRVH